MRRHGPQVIFFLLVVTAVIALSCGSSPRALNSVSVGPASGHAQAAGGQVQFTATGYYSTPPSPVTPAPALWEACYQGGLTTAVVMNSSGLATCTGSTGTYEVTAFVPNPAFRGVCGQGVLPCGGSCGGSVGTAQLTCQ
jgi:hypothetical protein